MKLNRQRCFFADDYAGVIDRLINGERFVLMFLQPLVVDEISHQTRIYMDDWLTSRAVLIGGADIPMCYLLDMAGTDYSLTTEGADLVDVASWLAGSFDGAYAGIYETPYIGGPDQMTIAEMIESTDLPDLWFLEESDVLSSILIFDPSNWIYVPVFSWIKGLDSPMPKNLDDAVRRLRNKKIQALIDQFRLSGGHERSKLRIKLLERLGGKS